MEQNPVEDQAQPHRRLSHQQPLDRNPAILEQIKFNEGIFE